MPFALHDVASDEEDDNEVGMIKPKQTRDKPNAEGANSDAEGDDDDEEAAEYIVERIIEHAWDNNEKIWKYKTKWIGWEEEDDMTWEPKENLEGAQESLDEYWESHGGEPDPRGPTKTAATGKKRGRPSGADSDVKKARLSPAPGRAGRRAVGVDDSEAWGPTDDREWTPPKAAKDAWEEQLLAVETIEPDSDGNYWAYLRWAVLDKDGKNRHTKHPLTAVYKAAPQTMLKFYEKHLVFSEKNAKK